MAGGNNFTKNFSKGKYSSTFNNTEVLNESRHQQKFPLLGGILEPGASINFNQEKDSESKRPKLDNYLQKEQSLFINQHQEEVKREINELLSEIKKLAKATDNLEQNIQIAIEQPIIENTVYERNFLLRLKNLITQFRLNVSQASTCLEMFQSRKKKKNAFWNKSKSGGQKYMESGEHSVARSAN